VKRKYFITHAIFITRFFLILTILTLTSLTLTSCSKEENIKKENTKEVNIEAKKIEIDTLFKIGKLIKEYKNGYSIFRYGDNQEIKIKLPDSVKKDISKNRDAYRVSICKDDEMLFARDYKDAIININTNDIYKVYNSYRLNDSEFEKLFNVIMIDYYKNIPEDKKCSRDAFDIEFFDLNFDGIDEMIITGSLKYFFNMHALPMFVVENKDGEYKVIYSYAAENFEIMEKIKNNYYVISDLNIAERGLKNPLAISVYYQYDGNKYVEYKKFNERLKLDD